MSESGENRISQRPKRKIYDDNLHAHFVTFSCFKRRRLLNPDRAKAIVIGNLHAQLRKRNGLCAGFVIMPDHVHAIVWFPQPKQLSGFMNKWKDQSSAAIKQLFAASFPAYWATLDATDGVWQPKYYAFNIYTRKKLDEKLDYMHKNPVEEGLVQRAVDYQWSSARWHILLTPVGIPIHCPPGLED
jgi:putative transposase